MNEASGKRGWEMCRKSKRYATHFIPTTSLGERYLCESAWAAVSKRHALDGLSNRDLFSHSSEGSASMPRRPAESGPGEGPS